MKVKRALVVAAAVATMISGQATAASPQQAKSATCTIAGWEKPPSVCASHTKVIAATCYICHGPNGKSSNAIPSLAGQDKAYVVTAMKEFRDGKREATVMKKYALGYTEDEYEAMGAFFARIK